MGDPVDQQREVRVRPQTTGTPSNVKQPMTLRLTLLAPNDSDHNTIHFTTWVEVLVVNDRDKPLPNEKCVLWSADGSKIEKKTDQNGVVRFDGLPLITDGATFEDLGTPGFQLLDILEEWPQETIGDFPKPEDYRRKDRMVHFVPIENAKFKVIINRLTEEHKLQHFVRQYVDHDARYWVSDPRIHDDRNKRWKWGRGAVCNQHVNFFLGYWYNYNSRFTTAGSASTTTCLPFYSSLRHTFDVNGNTVKHRGYSEFVEPVTGYGEALAPGPVPEASNCMKAYKIVEYIRISKYFDQDTGEPNDEGESLFDTLGNFNFYSLADIKSAKQATAIKDVRKWLKKHKDENGYTDREINRLNKTKIWEIVWKLDDSDAIDLELIKTLRKRIAWDHHAGLLLKRARDGGEPTETDDELWTFSADGSTSSATGPRIVMKRFSEKDLKRKFLHLGIWKMKTLRPGGYAPVSAEDNEGEVSIDDPSRFVFWQ